MRTALASILTVLLMCLGATAVVAHEEGEDHDHDDGDTHVTEPAVYFTGTFENTVTEMPDPVLNPETGVLEVRDGRLEFISDIGDPRIGSPYVIEPLNMDIDPQTGVGRMWGTGHNEGDEGAFEGPIWGLHYPVTEEISGFTGSGWLTGSGAYEGQTYFYRGSFDGEQSFIEGIIFEGDAPPLE